MMCGGRRIELFWVEWRRVLGWIGDFFRGRVGCLRFLGVLRWSMFMWVFLFFVFGVLVVCGWVGFWWVRSWGVGLFRCV